MNKTTFALAAIVATFAFSVHAIEYKWSTAVDGDWDDSTKWNQQSGCPDSDDVATMAVGGNYRLTLTDDVSVTQLKPQNKSGVTTINLGGHSIA